MNLTPAQVRTIAGRLTAETTTVEVRRWSSTTRKVEASYFARQRLLETVLVQPGGSSKVLS